VHSLASGQRIYNTSTSWTDQIVTTTITYNFMNNPLIKSVDEHEDGPNGVPDRDYTVGYAYWGANKFFQQKATQDQGGRYTFTDYYPTKFGGE
jgi:hypothetical protein